MKKLSFITVALLLFILAACRGPLAKPEASSAMPTAPAGMPGSVGMAHSGDATTGKEDIKIDPVEGCITIADLFSNKTKYSGETVRVRGKITKINPEIMGKNWIHLQDGTEFEGSFDLTATTEQQFTIGLIVTIEGKVAIDKDFGYGYSYAVIIEDCKLIP